MAATSAVINVFFDGKNANNMSVTPELAKKEIGFTWTQDFNLKTIIMYDTDAPYPPPRNTSSPMVHILAVNLRDVIEQTPISYLPPNPPVDSPPHTYMVELYRQTGPLSLEPLLDRSNFDVDKFAALHGLTLLARTSFQVGARTLLHSHDEIPFKPTSTLTESQKAHCRCRLEVGAKQPPACNLDKAYSASAAHSGSSIPRLPDQREGKTCYNPYAVCSRAGTRVRSCTEDYDFANMDDKYLIAYATLHGVRPPEPYNRAEMLKLIGSGL